MKIGRLLFKPKWQDKDPGVRAVAVASDDDPGLQAALPELTRSDPDARVRLAALKRIDDYERWRERSTGDDDAGVRRSARSAYLSLLCSDDSRVPPLARRIAELETLSVTEIEAVASSARDRGLRAAAFAYVARPALLAERAVADPDPELRRAALERIGDVGALERIAERTRKTDKLINRLARERLQALRIGAGDAVAIAERARALCERIETLLRAPGAELTAERARVAGEWDALGGELPVSLATRFRASLALLDGLLQAPAPALQPAVSEPASQAQPDASASSQLAPVSHVDAPEAEPVAGAEDATTAAAPPPQPAAPVPSAAPVGDESHAPGRSQRQAALQRIEERLGAYAQDIDAGDVGAARLVHAQIAAASAEAGPLPSALEHRLAPLHARFAELSRWQHWSNQRRRRALCQELEGLPVLGLHPDAVATRVREAKAEWQKLDAMESAGAAQGQGSGLTRRFYAACQHALKPAQTYFDKRDAVRDAHRRELEALLERIPAAAADDVDWKVQLGVRRELAAALRSLDAVDPRQRNELARRLKDAIAALSPRIEARESTVRAAKTRLIAEAQTQADKPGRDAARTVRELQQQWKAIGEGARGSDQRQWREFRAACDRVFDAIGSQRREREAQESARGAQAGAVLAAAEQLLADPRASADELVRGRRELDARWREVGPTDRGLERRYREFADALAARVAERARAQRLARFTAALDRYRSLRDIERGAASEWNEQDACGDAFAAGLEERARRAAGGGANATADSAAVESARDLLVRLEFAAGIASPDEDRERRMNYQVTRLSARMRGSEVSKPEVELEQLLASWFAFDPLPEALERRFVDAADAAIAALP